MGIAIIVPVLPAYLKELTGDTISEAAVDGGWLMLVYSACSSSLRRSSATCPTVSAAGRSCLPRC